MQLRVLNSSEKSVQEIFSRITVPLFSKTGVPAGYPGARSILKEGSYLLNVKLQRRDGK